jgi:hypothetical protein
MKRINLKAGFLVEDWSGKIIPVSYTIVQYENHGSTEERFLYCNKNSVFSEPINKWNSDKIFDSLEEAEKHSVIKKKERIEYYEKQIGYYSERLNYYKHENNNSQ